MPSVMTVSRSSSTMTTLRGRGSMRGGERVPRPACRAHAYRLSTNCYGSALDDGLEVDLDAPVGLAAAFGGVGGDGLRFALARDREAHRIDALRLEIMRHRMRAALRQGLVVGVGADIVGVADDGQRGLAVAH